MTAHKEKDDMLKGVIQSSCKRENKSVLVTKENEGDLDKNGTTAELSVPNPGVTSQTVALQPQDMVEEQKLNGSIGKWVNFDRRRKTESEPYPKNSFLRKYYKGKDNDLPKELKELFTPLKCNLCHCSMGSTVTAEDHYKGKKHILNMKKWLGEHTDYNVRFFLTETMHQKIIDPNGLYCKYCNVMMSSEQQAQSHYIGKKHQTVINSGVMNTVFLNTRTGQWDSSLTGASINFENDVAIVPKYKKWKDGTANQRFFCETCRVACPSQVTFSDHLAGAKHKKRMTLLLDSEPPPATKDNILEDVIKNEKKFTSPADLSIYRTPSGKYYCHSCNVTVNSPIQFLQHSESKKHKHKSTLSANKMCK